MGCFSVLNNNVFLFVGLTTLVLLIGLLSCVSNVSNTKCNLQRVFCVLTLLMYISLSAIVLSLLIPALSDCMSVFFIAIGEIIFGYQLIILDFFRFSLQSGSSIQLTSSFSLFVKYTQTHLFDFTEGNVIYLTFN